MAVTSIYFPSGRLFQALNDLEKIQLRQPAHGDNFILLQA